MNLEWLVGGQVAGVTHWLGVTAGLCLLVLLAYEWALGRYRDGKKTGIDWKMAGLCMAALALVQRPLLTLVVFVGLGAILPHGAGQLAFLEENAFWSCLVVYLLIDEWLHGRIHLFAHGRRPKNPVLRKVHAFYRVAHRPHHQIGGNDGRGELNVTQTYVEHWGWWVALPNYWFGLACLYFGLIEVFLWGTLSKSIWGMHVHTNWGRSYDLALLNHRSPIVRKTMRALCHLLVFPNQHHQHHSRSGNSAKNMTNFIAVWDWLLWDSLVIEPERPKVYGWKQTAREAESAAFRFFNTDLRRG